MRDPYNLQRFTDAQEPILERVEAELLAGHKQSHWMWFIFPQIAGLGNSDFSRKYAIATLAEATAYLHHPPLGDRLRECTRVVNAIERRTAAQIFGAPDELKFRSSMTLFVHATPDHQVFIDALQKYFGGVLDPATLERL